MCLSVRPLKKGGLAASAAEERWLRKLVRTFDPTTRQLKTEEVLRFTTAPDGSMKPWAGRSPC